MTIIAIGYTQIPFNIYLVKEMTRYLYGEASTTHMMSCDMRLKPQLSYEYSMKARAKVEMVLIIKRKNSLAGSKAPHTTFVISKTEIIEIS